MRDRVWAGKARHEFKSFQSTKNRCLSCIPVSMCSPNVYIIDEKVEETESHEVAFLVRQCPHPTVRCHFSMEGFEEVLQFNSSAAAAEFGATAGPRDGWDESADVWV